jgi:elongation factor G
MTSGGGTFRRAFARYEPMPGHLAEQFRKEHSNSR